MKNPYVHTSLFYKHLMRMIDYEGWAEYIHELILHYKIEPDYILELAAGDGRMSEYLADKYQKILLTDISYNMLKSSAGKVLNKVACEMTRIPFKIKFDFIYAVFDSVNYLVEENELEQLFNEISTVLSPMGIFTFDVSLEKNSLKNAKHLNRKGKYNGLRYKQKSNYNKASRIHENIFEIKLDDGSTLIETHQQKIYEFDKYFEVLDKSNLYVVNCFDFFSFDTADEKCERIQFVLARSN